jgi:hypothetical protein
MRIWRVEGFRGDKPTGMSRQITAGEKQIRVLLERLAARHLTEDEVIEATFGNRSDLHIHQDSGARRLTLMTTGADYHWVASVAKTREVRNGDMSSAKRRSYKKAGIK